MLAAGLARVVPEQLAPVVLLRRLRPQKKKRIIIIIVSLYIILGLGYDEIIYNIIIKTNKRRRRRAINYFFKFTKLTPKNTFVLDFGSVLLFLTML